MVSFWLKHNLDKFSKELDSKIIKPSDYCLKVTLIPKNWRPEFFKEQIEKYNFHKFEIKINCYQKSLHKLLFLLLIYTQIKM